MDDWWNGSQIVQQYSIDGKTICLYACSFKDNGGEFYVKIPINGLLYYKESLCGGSMTTYHLKVLLNTHGV